MTVTTAAYISTRVSDEVHAEYTEFVYCTVRIVFVHPLLNSHKSFPDDGNFNILLV
jgi:hypothetical protein